MFLLVIGDGLAYDPEQARVAHALRRQLLSVLALGYDRVTLGVGQGKINQLPQFLFGYFSDNFSEALGQRLGLVLRALWSPSIPFLKWSAFPWHIFGVFSPITSDTPQAPTTGAKPAGSAQGLPSIRHDGKTFAHHPYGLGSALGS